MLSQTVKFRTNQIVPVGGSLWWMLVLVLPFVAMFSLLGYYCLVQTPELARNEKVWLTLPPIEEARKDFRNGQIRFVTVYQPSLQIGDGREGGWVLPGEVSRENWLKYRGNNKAISSTHKLYSDKLQEIELLEQANRFATGYNTEMNRLINLNKR